MSLKHKHPGANQDNAHRDRRRKRRTFSNADCSFDKETIPCQNGLTKEEMFFTKLVDKN